MLFQMRDLSKTKKLRDKIKENGMANISQKRVIIAPPMEGTHARDVTLRDLKSITTEEEPEQILCFPKHELSTHYHDVFRLTSNGEGKSMDLHALNKEYHKYKKWLQKRKEICQDLDKIQDLQGWLKRKDDLTELESRVFVRFLPPISSPVSFQDDVTVESSVVTETLSPHPLTRGQARLLPLLRQPLPLALATIDYYLQSKKLRLIDLFTQIDKNKDWALSRDEITGIVLETDIPFTVGQIDELIIALDVNNDEKLTYQELVVGLEAYKIDTRWHRIKQILKVIKEEHEQDMQKNTFDTIPMRGRSTTWLHSKSSTVTPTLTVSDTSLDYSSNEVSSTNLATSSSLLQIPSITTTEKVEDDTTKIKEKRLRKQQQKKEKRAKQKIKRTEKFSLPPSTMTDPIGLSKDKYLAGQFDQMNSTLDVSHTKGVALRKELFERVFMIPPDKPKETIDKKIRQPGLHLISSLDNYLDCNDDNEQCDTDIIPQRKNKKRKSPSKRRQENLVDVFWPQSLLDKLRLCDDKPKARDKTQSLFYKVG